MNNICLPLVEQILTLICDPSYFYQINPSPSFPANNNSLTFPIEIDIFKIKIGLTFMKEKINQKLFTTQQCLLQRPVLLPHSQRTKYGHQQSQQSFYNSLIQFPNTFIILTNKHSISLLISPTSMMQQQIEEQRDKHVKKESHQLKALFYKNLTLQSRQPCTNFCQIFTPIICLVFTILIRNIVIDKIPPNDDNIYLKNPLIPIKFNNYTLADQFLKKNITRVCQQWYLFSVQNQVDEEFVGMKDGRQKHSSGLLGLIHDTYATQCGYNFSRTSQPLQYYHPPIFQKPAQSGNKDIYQITQYLNSVGHEEFKKYYQIHKMPDGSIKFNHANESSLSVTLLINDLRQLEYHRGDGITKISFHSQQTNSSSALYTIPEGLLSLQDTISSAYLKKLSNYSMEVGMMYMPIQDPTPAAVDVLISGVSMILFPVALSLLLPVFLYMIVLEKQEKLIQMMRMNGMKMRNFWLINFLFDFVLGLLTNIVFCIFGTLFLGGSFFRQTGWDVFLIVLVGWILAQISLATFFQAFITSSMAANIIGYLITIWTNLIGATLSLAIYQFPRQLPWFFVWYPTFAFDRLFYLMLTKCGDDNCYTSLSSLDSEAKHCLVILYISFVVFQLIGMYLFQVIPQQYGVRQKVTFPLDYLIRKCKGGAYSKSSKLQDREDLEIQPANSEEYKHYDNKKNNDSFAKNQKIKINKIDNFSQYALIAHQLRKVYQNGKLAVNDLSLVIEDKQVFGLLGPNGAGKTTLISMITGIFSPTNGDCFVAGHNISENIQQVHLNIGVCPQFDILWPQLTVQEHLYFYARLRGKPRALEKQCVAKALKQVNLEQFKTFSASQLSGGMKRRLSVGISMVGNPRIVFLDEPTTGLDPENRRNLWEVLNNCRNQRALFLTTHLMEQADTLCNRVGIITNGVLRTVGTPQQLKNAYGSGHYLSLNLQMHHPVLMHNKSSLLKRDSQFSDEGQMAIQSVLTQSPEGYIVDEAKLKDHHQQQKKKIEKIKSAVLEMFPSSWIDRQINGYLRFGLEDVKISHTLNLLNKSSVEQIQNNWGLSNSSLEDVFLNVIKKFQEFQVKQSLLSEDNVILSNTGTKSLLRKSIQSEEESDI